MSCSAPITQCDPATLPEFPNTFNDFNGDPRVESEDIYYYCNHNFVFDEYVANVYCTTSGTWSSAEDPECPATPQGCLNELPPHVQHANLISRDEVEARYECVAAPGTFVTLACTDNVWAAPVGEECPEPVTECTEEPPMVMFANSDYSTISPDKTVDATVTYKCRFTDDEAMTTCGANGLWTEVTLVCPEFPMSCSEEDLPFIEHGTLTTDGPYASGTNAATYACDNNGDEVTFDCNAQGIWELSLGAESCPPLITHCMGEIPTIADTTNDFNGHSQVGSEIIYWCDFKPSNTQIAGYISDCQEDGSWSFDPGFACSTIAEASCSGPPPFIEHATITYTEWSRYTANSVASYECMADDSMTDSSTCTNGEWTPTTLVCDEPITHCDAVSVPVFPDSFSHFNGNNMVGASFNHVCNYQEVMGVDKIFTTNCLPTGEWETMPEPVECPSHPQVITLILKRG